MAIRACRSTASESARAVSVMPCLIASRSRIGFSSPRKAPNTEIGTSVTTISRMI